jgi:hypothetical protein
LRRLAQQLGKPGFADLDRQPAQILAVKLNHVGPDQFGEGSANRRPLRGVR